MTLAAISLALTLVAGTCAAGEATSPLLPLGERKPAPELKLEDIDGKVRSLSELRGKVVLVNFWATWCPPCRREMPSMQRLYQSLSRENFEILAVNVGEDDGTIFAFTGTLEPSPDFPLLLDRDSLALRKWPVKGLPTSFVVDRQGRVALRAVGGRDFDSASMAAQLRTLLDETQ
jgi:thiol-disulfide isomerase/thioredoxin